MDKKELQKAQNIIDTLFYDEKALTQWQHTLLENVISIAQTKLRKPPVISSVCEKYPKPTQKYCYECEGCKKAMSEQTDA